KSLRSEDQETGAALKLLSAWDGTLDSNSPQAALEEVWFSRYLGQAFRESLLSKAAAEELERVDPRTMLDALERPESRFRENAIEQRDRILLTTLAAAYRELEKLQGVDSKQWQWGTLHFNICEHPLSPMLDEQTRTTVNVGPIPKHGGRYTVNASAYRTSDFRQIGGPSARLIIDVGNWDNSKAVNHPGESGDPSNSHYRDLAPLWRSGQYFLLLYSREAVENATENEIELIPETGQH